MADRPPMATPRVAAGALIRDPEGRVLLVKPTYKDGWDIPGGYVEPGESPAAACARELQEEIGLRRSLGPLLVVDWAPHPAEGDKLLFVFDGGRMTVSEALGLEPDGVEIAEIQFFAESELGSRMPERLARRLSLAITSAAGAAPIYAEHGSSMPTQVACHK